MTNTPQIYIACLSAYNGGYLHGKWIDATQEVDDIWNEINAVLKTSPIPNAEEWAIHDYDNFGNLRLGEYEGIENVHNIALFIKEHRELGIKLLKHFCDDLEQAKQSLAEGYIGDYESISDYAQELTESTGEISNHLQCYVNYEAMARDMEINGDFFTLELGHQEIHLFSAV